MNQTSQGSSPLRLRLEVAVPFVSVLTIIGLTSLASNALIIVIICKYWKRRKGYELFVLQNNLIDLVTTVITIPFWISTAIYEDKFEEGISCRMSASLCFMDIIAPVIFLMLASAYRHAALVGHEASKRVYTERRSLIFVLMVWLLTILLTLPQTFAWVSNPEATCVPDLASNIWFTMYTLVFFFFLPLAAAIYAHVYDIVSFQPEKMKQKSGPLYQYCKKQALKGEELEIQKSMLTVLAVHTGCWMPYVLVSVSENLAGSRAFFLMGVSFHVITLIIGLSGISLKGVLFCFGNPRIKSHAKELFGCLHVDTNEGHITREPVRGVVV